MMDADGHKLRQITSDKAEESPDQKRIYFGSKKDGNWELYYFELDNSKIVRMTENESIDGNPRLR